MMIESITKFTKKDESFIVDEKTYSDAYDFYLGLFRSHAFSIERHSEITPLSQNRALLFCLGYIT